MRNRPGMFWALALIAMSACTRPPTPTLRFPDGCSLLPPPSRHADTVTVAVFDAVEPEYAPWGHNPAERLVFAQLYETLVTVDCHGDVHPALAASWKRSRDGRRWRFLLRDNARFWDGTRLDAGGVVRSWMDALTLDTGVDSAVASGANAVDVYFAHAHREVPIALAAPAFAVTAPRGDTRWPSGTGRYQVVGRDERENGGGHGAVTVRPVRGGRAPVVRFVAAPAADMRDLIEGGFALVVTADPTVVEYATGQAHLATVGLPWETTYVLLSVSRARALRRGVSLPSIPLSLSESLARDAVRVDARACAQPPWLEGLAGCGAPPEPGEAEWTGARRVLYDDNDRVARDLAHRVVALSAAGPRESAGTALLSAAVPGLGGSGEAVSALGVRPGDLESSLRSGAEFAYVIALPSETPLPCHQARELVRRAPWLPGVDAGLSRALLPLVETRSHAIATDCGIDLVVDRFGALRIVRAGSPGR